MCTCVYGVLALVSHLSHFARRTTWQVCRGCTSEQLYCSWAHPEGNNTHLRLLHQEAGRQYCTAACGGVEVPCLLTFYHWDTRVLGKAKELVTKKFVLPDKTSFTDTQMLPQWPWLIALNPVIQTWLTRVDSEKVALIISCDWNNTGNIQLPLVKYASF